MSKLLDFQKYNFSQIQWKAIEILLCLFTFTLPFSIKFSNILLVALSVLLIFRKSFISDLKGGLSNHIFISFSGLFLIYFVSWLWSQNSKTAGFTLEKHLGLILIPLILIPSKAFFTKNMISKILSYFIAGISAALLWISFNILNAYKDTSGKLDIFHFFRERVVDYVQLHPTYLAMYMVFAISILVSLIIFQDKREYIIFRLLLISFMLGFILLSGARMPLIALGAVLIYFLFKWFYTSNFPVSYLFIGLASIGILLFGAFKTPIVQQRINELKYTRLAPPTGIHFNSVNLRVAQFNCSREILNDNWLWGVGLGDVQDALNDCYKSHGWSPALYERNYNAHNQYFQTFLTAGILGIFLLAGCFITLFASNPRNSIMVSLIIIFSMCCLTESMLEKNKGIIFFTFFAIAMSLEQIKRNEKPTS